MNQVCSMHQIEKNLILLVFDSNVAQLLFEPARVIEVHWKRESLHKFHSRLKRLTSFFTLILLAHDKAHYCPDFSQCKTRHTAST